MKYKIFRFVKNGQLRTRLISSEELKEATKWKKKPEEFFFEPDCSEIVEQGIIQVTGNTDKLDSIYTSDSGAGYK